MVSMPAAPTKEVTAKVVEPTVFDLSSPGRPGVTFPEPDVRRAELPAHLLRKDLPLPELAEVDVIRHYMHLSTFNYSVDGGFYPLGSCTMKYNSRLNERVARIAGFANLHPLAEERDAQGALEIIFELQQHLAEITGLPGISLQPAAGAHGEMTGIMIIRAFLDDRDGAGEGKEKKARHPLRSLR